MAEFTTNTVKSTTYQWKVRFPAAIAEVYKAMNAAEKSYRTINKFPEDKYLSDDALWSVPDDEYFVIQFTVIESDD
jgi:hypothetical protein